MTEAKDPLVVIAGPTATGKSSAAVELCRQIEAEVISADSMQVYVGLDIGSAKVTKEEMKGVPHHLIDVLPATSDFNVYKFKQLAKAAIEDIRSRGRIPVIAGGTGFYIQAMLYDIDFSEDENDMEYRRWLEGLAKEGKSDKLYELLRQKDPEAAGSIHPNNIKRVIRALEYNRLTGERISEHNRQMRKKRSPYNFCYFVLNDDRKQIYSDINRRVDIMAQAGLMDEVKRLMDEGVTREMTSMQGIGYKEMAAHLLGECSYEEAIEQIKLDTRHFAKRQLTWFKREKDVIWIDKREYGTTELIVEEMIRYLKEAGIWIS